MSAADIYLDEGSFHSQELTDLSIIKPNSEGHTGGAPARILPIVQ
jgi:hypothetical protein